VPITNTVGYKMKLKKTEVKLIEEDHKFNIMYHLCHDTDVPDCIRRDKSHGGEGGYDVAHS
jgi:hypothetical protein